jgi:hypothetical protein
VPPRRPRFAIGLAGRNGAHGAVADTPRGHFPSPGRWPDGLAVDAGDRSRTRNWKRAGARAPAQTMMTMRRFPRRPHPCG